MSVTFIFGRAGSGKTLHCYRTIVEMTRQHPLGPPIYWLLPKQATFSAERDLTCHSGLEAFCRARVVSFEEFGNDIFEDCGGSSIPQVTPLGRQMIIGHLLRQNRSRLRFYSRVARQPGLAAELDRTFAELERSGRTVEDLGAVMEEISQTNAADLELAPLLDKLHDARLLYDAYVGYLGQDRLDQHRRLTQVLQSMSHCSFLSKTTLFVDGFTDFTEYERRILVGAAKAGARLQITLTIDPRSPVVDNPHTLPDEMSLFRKTEEAYRKLHFAFTQENVPPAEPLNLEPQHHLRSSAIQEIERSLFRDPIQASADLEGIERIEAPDRRAELDAVARTIRSLLMQGLRFRDIGVLARDVGRYHELIEASFQEHGIPYFLDRRRTAAHHPLLEMLRAVFQIAGNDWPHEATMSLLRSGLAGISLYDADGLENYVLAHRIRGAAGWEAQKPWGYRRQTIGAEEEGIRASGGAEQADRLRRQIVDKLSPLLSKLRTDDPIPVRDISAEIFNTLDRFQVRRTIGQWIDAAIQVNQIERGAEHEQVWLNVVDLFEQLVDLLGDERMTPGEFNDVLEAGLESFDLALTPPTVDQVLVGQVDRTRTQPLRAVYVLGMNEGEFPRAGTDGSILTDRDRRTLRQRRIDLDPGLQQRLLDERFLAYVAFTRASERLYLCRPLADDEGRPAEPSSFWHRISQLLPAAPLTRVPPTHDPAPQNIATPRQLVTSLMRWVRGHPDPVNSGGDPAWPAMYQWLATSKDIGDAISTTRYRAWRALSYSNAAGLSPDVARELFRSPLRAGVSQLETFAACPFKHFARFALGLRERERQEVTIQDLGRLYHNLLEDALKDVMRRRAEGDRTARLEEAIDGLVEQIGSALREELMLESARNRYLLERTRKASRQIALAQREILKRGAFRPTHVGIRFGQGGNMPALILPTRDGGQVLLEGKIDRVDRIEKGDEVAVIDYRLGAGRLPVGMVLHGLSLQLLSYLLVLESNGQQLSGRSLQPAAAFYLQLIRRFEDVKHPDEALDPADPKWHLKLKPRGLFDRRYLPALDRELAGGRSEVVQAYVKQDGSLGHRHNSDAVESDEFRALLKVAAARLAELGEGILSGKIDISPYRLNDKSPCPRCEYRAVCRFDPAINKYNHLSPLSMEDVLSKATKGGDHA